MLISEVQPHRQLHLVEQIVDLGAEPRALLPPKLTFLNTATFVLP